MICIMKVTKALHRDVLKNYEPGVHVDEDRLESLRDRLDRSKKNVVKVNFFFISSYFVNNM